MTTEYADTKFKHADIQLSNIIQTVNEQHREPNEDFVAALADSIKRGGLRNRVLVHKAEGPVNVEGCMRKNVYFLHAGRQRYAAFELLGRDKIPAVILPPGMDEAQYRLAEIEENLTRLELTVSERLQLVAEQNKILGITPESRKRAARKKGANASNKKQGKANGADDAATVAAASHTANEAAKSGKSQRTARRDQRHASVPNIADVAGTSLDSTKERDALARLHELDPAAAQDLIERAKAGEAVSAVDYLAEHFPKAPKATEPESAAADTEAADDTEAAAPSSKAAKKAAAAEAKAAAFNRTRALKRLHAQITDFRVKELDNIKAALTTFQSDNLDQLSDSRLEKFDDEWSDFRQSAGILLGNLW